LGAFHTLLTVCTVPGSAICPGQCEQGYVPLFHIKEGKDNGNMEGLPIFALLYTSWRRMSW